MITRYPIVIALVMLLMACQTRQTEQPPQSPAVEVDPETKEPLQAGQLRSNQVRTRHVFDGAVTSGKLAIKAVAITVTAAGTAGSSAADATLAGGFLVGCHPTGNQDQHIDNVVLNADGSITVTLAVAATANNTFSCKAIKANAKGIS